MKAIYVPTVHGDALFLGDDRHREILDGNVIVLAGKNDGRGKGVGPVRAIDELLGGLL